MTDLLHVDAVYVLSVRSFDDRIAHINKELARHAIAFEFIFEHDIPDLTQETLDACFLPGCAIGLPQQSLVLKHLQAWKLCVQRGHRRILVLEDDACLCDGFPSKLNEALAAADRLDPGYLLFLGGADTRVPSAYFLERGPIFKNPIATADGYVTDAAACLRRIEWIREHKANLPADHLLKHVDRECKTDQYWTTTTMVEQGSVFGLFTSTLDSGRRKHSNAYNLMRTRWKKFQRRTLPGWVTRLLHRLRLR